MNDISILYYTCNLISDFFANNIRKSLIESSGGKMPIISISQKPLNFGKNIYVGDIGISVYNIYKQILIGAKEAKTKYVACCEDDSIYVPDHFEFEPPDDAFCYNGNHLGVDKNVGFVFRHRMNMCMCVAPTELIIETLGLRFQKYPDFLDNTQCSGFSEPGRHEERLGLPPVKRMGFRTKNPCLTWNHRPSQGGVRKILERHQVIPTDPYWGDGRELWRKIHG